MKEEYFMVGYFWILSLLGAAFYGHEIAQMDLDRTRSIARNELRKCHEVLTGGLYERNER